MALKDGQLGFWAKRTQDANPQFISLSPGETDVEKWKNEWRDRENTQWVGDTPDDFYNFYEPSSKFTEEGADVVDDTYFDVLLKDIESEYSAQRGQAEQSYETLSSQMKESRTLFDKGMERDYGNLLEDVNISAYGRGTGESGIKGRDITETTEEKDYVTEQRDLLEEQKQEIASQERADRLSSISRSESRARSNLQSSRDSSPYSDYSVL